VKKLAQTDAIFDQVHQVNQAADADETMLRISLDAKAPLRMGLFSRGGLNRVVVKGLDHDFQGKTPQITPFGLYLPQHHELYLYFTATKVTSDFMVDCLADFWCSVRERYPTVTTLVINLDNGPENHSRRTQFMHRITHFVDHFQLSVQLAYYPPYHSKYNPIERVWGFLEQHWNGSLLDSVETILNFARTFSFHQVTPVVQFVSKTYQSGARLTQKQMRRLEQRFQRLKGLNKWFVLIEPLTAAHPA
jgi:transposase